MNTNTVSELNRNASMEHQLTLAFRMIPDVAKYDALMAIQCIIAAISPSAAENIVILDQFRK